MNSNYRRFLSVSITLAAAALVPLGLHMASVFDNSGVGACLAHGGSGCHSSIEGGGAALV